MQGMQMGGEAMVGWWAMYLGPFTVLVVLVVFVALITFLIRRKMGSSKGNATSYNNALALLNERFAKGDFDAREFEKRKKKLRRL